MEAGASTSSFVAHLGGNLWFPGGGVRGSAAFGEPNQKVHDTL